MKKIAAAVAAFTQLVWFGWVHLQLLFFVWVAVSPTQGQRHSLGFSDMYCVHGQ